MRDGIGLTSMWNNSSMRRLRTFELCELAHSVMLTFIYRALSKANLTKSRMFMKLPPSSLECWKRLESRKLLLLSCIIVI